MIESELTGHFEDSTGNILSSYNFVAPLLGKENGKLVGLGTSFFISERGLLLTAKHCLFDENNSLYQGFVIVQFTKDRRYQLRPIYQVSYDNNSDIAVLLTFNQRVQSTGKFLVGPRVSLTTKEQSVGESIASYAYPLSPVDYSKGDAVLRLNEMYYSGVIETLLRESPLLKNICYQTTMDIHHGSSGGPVFNSDGKVFAVNSSSLPRFEEVKPVSFITPINYCLHLKVNGYDGKQYSIKDLAGMNFMSLEV